MDSAEVTELRKRVDELEREIAELRQENAQFRTQGFAAATASQVSSQVSTAVNSTTEQTASSGSEQNGGPPAPPTVASAFDQAGSAAAGTRSKFCYLFPLSVSTMSQPMLPQVHVRHSDGDNNTKVWYSIREADGEPWESYRPDPSTNLLRDDEEVITIERMISALQALIFAAVEMNDHSSGNRLPKDIGANFWLPQVNPISGVVFGATAVNKGIYKGVLHAAEEGLTYLEMNIENDEVVPTDMAWFQTLRGYYYKYQKMDGDDPQTARLYTNSTTASSHISALADALCIDRVSIGFRPRIDSKFYGPFMIVRPEETLDGFPGAEQTSCDERVDQICEEWLRVFNGGLPKRELIPTSEVGIKGVAIFEDEGMFQLVFVQYRGSANLTLNISTQRIQASFHHYRRKLASLGYISIHTSGYMSSYTKWFVRYLKLYFEDGRAGEETRDFDILFFVDMDKGGVTIMRQLEEDTVSNTVPEFERNIKLTSKWAGLHYSYLAHLMEPKGTPTKYGVGAGLTRKEDINIMTCDDAHKRILEGLRKKYADIADDGRKNSSVREKAKKRRTEIELIIKHGISSIAAVPVREMIRDMEVIIKNAI
ncbi:hypothetical protein THAOC_21842 [Thalassiosira oceanica]|uniref:Uncharacterized protein n=1 Tax=Thalassiosira oceanica TaxID=159749 RepID=K0RYG8_THAOC|nr:hypothetical protein THAOC_21842 [Thalassiosira oceanica]|eukprot:EJK58060.1 hypothetical protein THAOC_21842 [Thalassiosira oceanica]